MTSLPVRILEQLGLRAWRVRFTNDHPQPTRFHIYLPADKGVSADGAVELLALAGALPKLDAPLPECPELTPINYQYHCEAGQAVFVLTVEYRKTRRQAVAETGHEFTLNVDGSASNADWIKRTRKD